jgi:hypothetical protein
VFEQRRDLTYRHLFHPIAKMCPDRAPQSHATVQGWFTKNKKLTDKELFLALVAVLRLRSPSLPGQLTPATCNPR